MGKYIINLEEGNHNWHKVNMITITKNKQMYDKYKCLKCGITGKRHGLSDSIVIDGNPNKDKVNNCIEETGINYTNIKITNCKAIGKAFSNLLPDSIHLIIPPPIEYKDKYKNDYSGVWVMGVGEPVRVLKEEFIPVRGMIRRTVLLYK